MKTSGWILATVMGVSLAITGCNKQGGIDTSALEAKFQASEPALKASADKAVAAIKSADYSGALAELKTLASNANLTPEQQQTIKDVMAQVQKAITDAATKAAGEANKAVQELPKSVPK